MKTVFEYIEFEELSHTGTTRRWACKNLRSGGVLGWVGWYGPWRQFCFNPVPQSVVFNGGCLKDIQAFLAAAMEDYRASKKDKEEKSCR